MSVVQPDPLTVQVAQTMRPGHWAVFLHRELEPGKTCLVIEQGRKSSYFWLEYVPVAWDDDEDGYHLQKWQSVPGTDPEADEYYVRFPVGEPPSCECKGWLRHGRCKHIRALAELRAAGTLASHPGNHPAALGDGRDESPF